jgi:histidine triad (HIT) family protein
MVDDCVFCKIASGEAEAEKIYESDNFFAIRDANPRTLGHSLVIPKKHFVNTMDLPSTLGKELLDAVKDVASDLLKAEDIEGFNILQNNFSVGGQLVMHAHFHVIPRRKGDGLKPLG